MDNMSNTIKIGTNNINAIKLGSVDVDAVYLGTNLVYTSTPPTPQSSCYEIVPIPITSYTSTTYDSVYSASDEKWYMKNNLNQYEEYGIYETGTSLSDFTYYDGKLTAIGTTEYQWDGSQWQNVGVYESSETTWTIDDTSPSPYEGETLSTSFKIPIEDISEIGYLNLNIEVSGGRLRIYSDNYTYENDDSGDYEEGTVTDDGTYLNYSLPTTKEVVVEYIDYWNPTPIHLIMGDIEISVEYSAKTVSANVYQSVAEMEAVGCPTVGVGQYGFVGNDIYKYTNNEEWIGTSLQDPKMVAFYSSGTPLVVYNDSDTTLSSSETKASTLPIEVYVGNSVTTIGNAAFMACSGLISIDIPNSVTSIGRNVFTNCRSLTSIDIPNSVTSIGYGAFSNCSSLTSVTIPNSVTSIGNEAFQGCSGLTSITIPNSVISIGSGAFSNTPWWNSYSADTSHRYGNIIYINDVAYVATSTGITSCTFKEGSLSIGGGAFSGCKKLTSVNIPNSVTSIGDSAFNYCSGLTTCTIGSGVTSIGVQAFNYCSGLTNVTIGSGVTTIGDYAFNYCKKLTTVNIPNSVTSIGNGAFNYCSGLTSVIVNATEPPTLGGSAFNNTNNCPIYVPSSAVEAYKNATNWSDYASRIQANPT